MKAVRGDDLLRLLKNYGRDKPLLRDVTGKKGKEVRLYLEREGVGGEGEGERYSSL